MDYFVKQPIQPIQQQQSGSGTQQNGDFFTGGGDYFGQFDEKGFIKSKNIF
jgi:hypothetical protein